MSVFSTTRRAFYLCAKNDQGLVPAGTTICTLTPPATCSDCDGIIATPTVVWNIQPNQIGVFAKVDTAGVNDIAIDPTVADWQDTIIRGNFYIAMGVDSTGNGVTDRVVKGTSQYISYCDITNVSAKPYTPQQVETVKILFDCTECEEHYGIKVQTRNAKVRNLFGPERFPIDHYQVDTNCFDCATCTPQHNCDEIYELLSCEYKKFSSDQYMPHNDELFGQYPLYNIEQLSGADLEEYECDGVTLKKTWTCGIRFTGLLEDRVCEHDPLLNHVRHPGTRLEVFPGSGWKNGKNFVMIRETDLVLEEGGGDVVRWREIFSNQELAGTNYYLDSKDMVSPYPYTKQLTTAQCECDENYCQIVMDFNKPSYISGTQHNNISTGQMIIAVPEADTTTQGEVVAAINGILTALNKPLPDIAC